MTEEGGQTKQPTPLPGWRSPWVYFIVVPIVGTAGAALTITITALEGLSGHDLAYELYAKTAKASLSLIVSIVIGYLIAAAGIGIVQQWRKYCPRTEPKSTRRQLGEVLSFNKKRMLKARGTKWEGFAKFRYRLARSRLFSVMVACGEPMVKFMFTYYAVSIAFMISLVAFVPIVEALRVLHRIAHGS